MNDNLFARVADLFAENPPGRFYDGTTTIETKNGPATVPAAILTIEDHRGHLTYEILGVEAACFR